MMCGGGGGSRKTKKPEESTPAISPVVQAMIDAVSTGPTGYSDDIMKNLGMDIRNHGYQGGARPQSGMTQTGQGPFGYQPTPAKADPLSPLLSEQPKGPASNVTVDDLFMKHPSGQKGSDTSKKSPFGFNRS